MLLVPGDLLHELPGCQLLCVKCKFLEFGDEVLSEGIVALGELPRDQVHSDDITYLLARFERQTNIVKHFDLEAHIRNEGD